MKNHSNTTIWIAIVLLILFLCIMLSACSKDESIVSHKTTISMFSVTKTPFTIVLRGIEPIQVIGIALHSNMSSVGDSDDVKLILWHTGGSYDTLLFKGGKINIDNMSGYMGESNRKNALIGSFLVNNKIPTDPLFCWSGYVVYIYKEQ